MKKLLLNFLLILSIAFLIGCQTVADHRRELNESSEQKLTLGIVQKEIKNGMAQAEVAKALGSPNLVTKDKDNIETWIYDKISTEYAYSASSGGISSLVLGGADNIGGLVGGSTSRASGASSRTQKTLTIIIKFKNSLVSEFTYNATSF